MTFAVVARCPKSGMFGTAVASSSPAVAARCSFVRAGVGAVSSQNITDPSLGEHALDLMYDGSSAADALGGIAQNMPNAEYRQLIAVDNDGNAAAFSGAHTLGTWAQRHEKNAAAAGNLLANPQVIDAMIDEFLNTQGRGAHLGDCLMASLAAALAAGGEAGPVHSAGMKIAHQTQWAYVDLRCDWSADDCPIANLQRAWDVYKPQMDDYITRAHHPQNAPSFNVAGAPANESHKANTTNEEQQP